MNVVLVLKRVDVVGVSSLYTVSFFLSSSFLPIRITVVSLWLLLIEL